MYFVPRIMDTSLVRVSPAVESLHIEQINAFIEQGYLVLPSFLPVELVTMLKQEADRWIDEGLRDRSIAYCRSQIRHPPPLMELELEAHGWLISYPPLMAVLTQLMGSVFAFHHLHSDRHDSGLPGKNWHHDYEQYPQANRSHIMVHALHYLDGLNGTIGDLVVLPGSQNIVAEKNTFSRFGTASLPGEVVINQLPPGSTVLIHSALFHARRDRAGGEGQSRYLVDCAYCQAGVRWPVVKPYWKQMLARARELGLDRRQWTALFADQHFYDPYDNIVAFEQINQGSLLEQLIPTVTPAPNEG